MHAHVMQCVALRESAVDESTRGQKAEHVDPKPNHKKIDSYSSNAMGHAVDSSFHRFLWLLVLSWPMDNAAPQGFNFLIVVSRCKGMSRLFSLLLDSTFSGGVESTHSTPHKTKSRFSTGHRRSP